MAGVCRWTAVVELWVGLELELHVGDSERAPAAAMTAFDFLFARANGSRLQLHLKSWIL